MTTVIGSVTVYAAGVNHQLENASFEQASAAFWNKQIRLGEGGLSVSNESHTGQHSVMITTDKGIEANRKAVPC